MDEEQLEEIAKETVEDLSLSLEVGIRQVLIRRMEQLERDRIYLGNGFHRAQKMTAVLMPGVKELLPGLVNEALHVE